MRINSDSRLWSDLHVTNSTMNTSTASLWTTTSGGGTSDVIYTLASKADGQTKWGPCGGVMWILCCMVGSSTCTLAFCLHCRSLPRWKGGIPRRWWPRTRRKSKQTWTARGFVGGCHANGIGWAPFRPSTVLGMALPRDLWWYMGWLTTNLCASSDLGGHHLAQAHENMPKINLLWSSHIYFKIFLH